MHMRYVENSLVYPVLILSSCPCGEELVTIGTQPLNAYKIHLEMVGLLVPVADHTDT